MTHVVVTRPIPEPAMALLRAAEVCGCSQDRPLTRDELCDAVRGATAVISMLHERVDAEVLDAAGPQLRLIANVAVGYDNVEVAAAAVRDVMVTNAPGVLTEATADLTLGLMLMLTRRLGGGERFVRLRKPWSFQLNFMLGTELRDVLLGIVGLGQIGPAVARRAQAFGMRVAYAGHRTAEPHVEAALGARRLALLGAADMVSLHCPPTPQTRHLVRSETLRAMKPTAFLVNTTRGLGVDEPALADALAAGTIAGATLDAFENDPAVEPRLLAADNAVVTPHVGSATVQTRTAMAELAARNVLATLSGEPPLTPVPAPASGQG